MDSSPGQRFSKRMLIANVAFIPIGILCAKYCVKLLAMPKPILASLVLALAVIGSYAVNGSIVEVWVMIGFGALGCAMKHFNLPREPLVLGLVLGTMAESELARALALVQGDVSQLLLGIFSSPICMILIGLILYSIIRSQYKKRKASAKPSDQKTELSEEGRITAASLQFSSSSTRRGGGQLRGDRTFRSHCISLRFPLRPPLLPC